MQSQLSTVAGEMQKLSGRFDENKYSVEKTLKDSTAEVELLKTQMTAMEKQVREVKDRLNALEGHAKQQPESAQQEQAKRTGKETIRVSHSRIKCIECGIQEEKKLASDYGIKTIINLADLLRIK